MVQKHEMIAEFEKLNYGPQELKKVWAESLDRTEQLVRANLTSYELISFIQWVNSNVYSEMFFAGYSMGTLLISKPNNGKLNYQQTFTIQYDNRTKLFNMKYSDWYSIEKREDSEKAVLWERTSPGISLCQDFVEFIEWNKNWC